MALLAPSEYGCIPWHTGMVLEGENVVIMIAIVVDGDATVDGCCFAVDVVQLIDKQRYGQDISRSPPLTPQ